MADRVYTVDFLLHSPQGWSVLELDGRGHDARGELERTLALGLPVVRMTEADVLEQVRQIISRAA